MWDSGGPRIFCPLIPQVSLVPNQSYSSRVHACVVREIRAGGCLEAGMTSVTRMTAKSFAVFRT